MIKNNKKENIYLTICILITFLFLIPNLNNGFLNWDDQEYVINNPLIKDLSFQGVKNIFKLNGVVATYSPIILISWALDYSIFGLNPAMFHGTNLLLHLIVLVLVFYFTKILTKDINVAFVVTLLFGMHPMHVEAVGWISARKDLLYTLFFIAGLIVYYFYTEKQQKYPKSYYYTLCLLLYLLSLFSKGTAVTFPLILLLLDYFKKRKDVVIAIFEKLPFFILSGVFIYISILMQEEGGAMEKRKFVSIIESLSVGSYGYFNYLVKSIVPYNLSAYHPYPYQLGQNIPWYYYLSIVPVIALISVLIINIKKKRHLVFGLGFFFISLIPVVQVLPMGTAVTADRYTYLPYLGLFYLFAFYGVKYFNKTKKNNWVLGGFIIYILILGIISFNYSKTFKSGGTLWSNVIKNYPNDYFAYMNKTDYLIGEQLYSEALSNANNAIEIKINNPWLFYNRAIVYKEIKNNDLALKDLNKAILLNPDFVSSYLNRGIIYSEAKDFKNAISDFEKVIEIDSINYKAFYNKAIAYKRLGLYDKAIQDLSKVISLNKLLPLAFEKRGDTQLLLGKIDLGLLDFSEAIKNDPNTSRSFVKRGLIYFDNKQFELAKLDFKSAIKLDNTLIKAYINLGIIYLNKNQYNKAIDCFNTAQNLDPFNYLVYYNRGLLQFQLKNYLIAIEEFDKCIKINPSFNSAIRNKNKIRALLKDN